MSRTAGFFWQLAVTAVGALLDYLVGRLVGAPTFGIICWAAFTLFTAAALEFYKDLRRERKGDGNHTSTYLRTPSVLNLIRPPSDYRWATVTRALKAALFAGMAYYAFALAIITFRFLIAHDGLWLGKHSPYDQTALTFIDNFQTSAQTAALIGAALVLAVIVRSDALLPCGVVLISVMNAWLVRLPGTRPTTPAPTFHSQAAYSLSAADKWLFQLPMADVLWGCLIPLFAGVIFCGVVSRSVRL